MTKQVDQYQSYEMDILTFENLTVDFKIVRIEFSERDAKLK